MRRNALSSAAVSRSVLPSPSLTARSLDDALRRLRHYDPREHVFPTPFGLSFGLLRRGSNVPGPIEALRRLTKRTVAGTTTPRPPSSIPPPPVALARNPRPQPAAGQSSDDQNIDAWAARIFGSLADAPSLGRHSDVSPPDRLSLEPESDPSPSNEPLDLDHLHTVDEIREATPRFLERYLPWEFSKAAFKRLCDVDSSPIDLLSFLQDPALTAPGSFCFSAFLKHATQRNWHHAHLTAYPEVLERGIVLGLLTLKEVCDLPQHMAKSPLDANPELIHIACRRIYWSLCNSKVMGPNFNILYQLLALLEPLPWGLSSIRRDIRAHLTRLWEKHDSERPSKSSRVPESSKALSFKIKSKLDERLDRHASPGGNTTSPFNTTTPTDQPVSHVQDAAAWFETLEATLRHSVARPVAESVVSNKAFNQPETTPTLEDPPDIKLPQSLLVLSLSQRARCVSRPEDLWNGLSGYDPMSVCRTMFQFWDQNDVQFRHTQRKHMLRKARFFFETSPKIARQASSSIGVDEMFNLLFSTLDAGSSDTSRSMEDVYGATRSLYGYGGVVALSERIWEYWPADDKWRLLRQIMTCVANILPWQRGIRVSDPELQPLIMRLHGFFRHRVFKESENTYHQPLPPEGRYDLPLRTATLLQHVMHDIAAAVAADVGNNRREAQTTIRHCYFHLIRYKVPVLRSLPIALVQTCIVRPIVYGEGYNETNLSWVTGIVCRHEGREVAGNLKQLAKAWQASARKARLLSGNQRGGAKPGGFSDTQQAQTLQRAQRRVSNGPGDLISKGPTATEPGNLEINRAEGGEQGTASDSSPNFIFCKWPPLRRTGRNWRIVSAD